MPASRWVRRALTRWLPDSCDWSLIEDQPGGITRVYSVNGGEKGSCHWCGNPHWNNATCRLFSGLGRTKMKKAVVMILLALPLSIPAETAHAKGCIKGALAGGVIGHYAGRHCALGAIAGCLYGRHEANRRHDAYSGRREPVRGWI
ncbi:hypothetical protein LMG27198_13740 [Methylocystis echinoides]|uniref:Uncharacterized protein n=2 Tax=Methylocystis echinoides TaxID=29468 RepID=A0A9W6GSN9_9HYPH|nr:hypothetical protein LMG27198_13740 [Methylocystis echinoides]